MTLFPVLSTLVDKTNPFHVDMTIEQALKLIQKNERGRVGVQRALMVSEWKRDAQRKEARALDGKAASPDEDEKCQMQIFAATTISAHWKRTVARKKFLRMKEQEFQFLGMAPTTNTAVLKFDI